MRLIKIQNTKQVSGIYSLPYSDRVYCHDHYLLVSLEFLERTNNPYLMIANSPLMFISENRHCALLYIFDLKCALQPTEEVLSQDCRFMYYQVLISWGARTSVVLINIATALLLKGRDAPVGLWFAVWSTSRTVYFWFRGSPFKAPIVLHWECSRHKTKKFWFWIC